MKNPLMMSRTSVCAPKPTARPAIPAPVSTGVMLTPNSSSTISTASAGDRNGRDVADERPERPRALGALERVEGRALADFVLEATHEQAVVRTSA